ncbi:hypothetical protein PHSY_003850 [Pseudozyma hubeiensis SY62]|uniref:Uncharacterized protein n=1 Tax=Pseudozyma hubeiensis (strain SY62) TaxID=1305764 RepID=R9PDV6_PSEHS|nr:hypothetical protein PHSY_003850 [Pseudozyma hubeiensis SY62]GAC96270.1 hypothetical protein PHSY_003850 [Pseudozyma hubeiensis SY62]
MTESGVNVECIRSSPLHSTLADSDNTTTYIVINDLLAAVSICSTWNSCGQRCFVSNRTVLGNHHVSPDSHHRSQHRDDVKPGTSNNGNNVRSSRLSFAQQ